MAEVLQSTVESNEILALDSLRNIRKLSCFQPNNTKLLNENFYFKSCKWSPDNLCLLVSDNTNEANIFNLPPLYFGNSDNNEWKSCLKIIEAEIIYDIDWYPFMDSSNPETCVFATTSKDHPIHLWDAYTSTLRCSYSCLNNSDEIISPIGISFSPDGYNLVCGSKNKLFIFDVNQPQAGPILTLNSKDNDKLHTGIYSCFSFSDTDNMNAICAVGSYNKTVGMYDIGAGQLLNLINLEQYYKGNKKSPGGVTQVKIIKNNLFVGCRSCDVIFRFDMRNYRQELLLYHRHVDNQQKISFCLNSNASSMIGGDTQGYLSFWSIDKNYGENVMIEPLCKLKISDESLPGCDFNSTYDLLAIATGSRSFKDIFDFSETNLNKSSSTLNLFKLESSFLNHAL
ncbi:hypothetical protein HZS_2131 [Henneguya salminicola]|nr:hypothetical protein HZS_2131 [Henneguya salminicola]